jgi:hypothetical protein
MKHLKNIEDVLNNVEISTDIRYNVSPENIRSLLPHEITNFELHDNNNYASWVVEATDEDDDNKSFTIYYSFVDGSIGWEGNDIASGAEYYKPVKTTKEFEQAMDDWNYDIDKWFY